MVLSACLDDSGTRPDSVPLGALQSSLNYSVSGDQLIYHTPAWEDRYCILDSLAVDKSSARDDTIRFSIVGDTLILTPKPESLDSGLVIQETFLLIRQAEGLGLEGVWKTGPMRYSHLSGVLTPAWKALLDTQYARNTEDAQYFYAYHEFKRGTLTHYSDYDWAEKFIRDWKRGWWDISHGDTSFDPYAVEMRRLDKQNVEIKGGKTGEKVRITFLDNGDRHYESDVAEHPAAWFRSKPTTCPNEYQPSWYTLFLQANRKDGEAAKRAANAASLPGKPFPGFSGYKMPLWPK
jgi:hypothetical protein